MLKVKLRGVRYSFAVEELASLPCLRGASHADAERIVHRAIKEVVLDGGDYCLGLNHMKSAGKGERSRLPKVAKEGR